MNYSAKINEYFDACLNDAYTMQQAMQEVNTTKPASASNAHGDAIAGAIDAQGHLICQVKAPVITMAVMAYCREYLKRHDTDKLKQLTLDQVCDELQIPATHRHQADWPLKLLQSMT